jgi:hypothetical protein
MNAVLLELAITSVVCASPFRESVSKQTPKDFAIPNTCTTINHRKSVRIARIIYGLRRPVG